ncbi:hypothetical protein [Aggregatibacter kilianii]|uniref:hypothetical protein n=1 Tax=Aggregatibacter kilianii TaxID=2025884 RepID=UPI0013A6570A|nr:hypothetical protein [Aggregatibacter kilianii]
MSECIDIDIIIDAQIIVDVEIGRQLIINEEIKIAESLPDLVAFWLENGTK